MVTLAPLDVVFACGALSLAVVLGTIAHELAHAVVLRAFDVPHDVRWFPDRRADGHVVAGLFGRWAAVVPRRLPTGLSPWGLRLAALAPLALATPFALVLLGVLPDPLASGNVLLAAATVGWFACAIPSPTDFSLVWYAERALEDGAGALSEVGDRGHRGQ